MAKKLTAVNQAPRNEKKATDNLPDHTVAHGYDPFNGEVYCFFDGNGYWLENWRTEHYSEYLTDEKGNLITDEDTALACHEKECANAHFNAPLYL
jgi:hypothetical protein